MKMSFAGMTIAASVVLAVSCGQLHGADAKRLSRGELHEMIRNAHTSEQYQALAQYYREKQIDLEEQARAERIEWISLSRGVTWSRTKAPAPAEFARNWYEHLSGKAESMGEKAQRFEDLEDGSR